MRGTTYQLFLIFLLVVVTALFGIFLYREVFPEYKIYQKAFVSLETFRSGLSGEAPAPFEFGVKQIVITKPDQGPETIDRCTSCHLALQIDAYSPTKIAKDINGDVIRDSDGIPVQVPNENYVFSQLDKAIQEAKTPAEIQRLEAMKTTQVHGKPVELAKVLRTHSLLGKELRPFEFHSPDEIGCTSCHNGNGRALTAEKAHGPVFDGDYEESFEGPKPRFLESDPDNDPLFSRVFNHKPGHELLFQTTPIFVGGLIQANCVQCHRSSNSQITGAVNAIGYLNDEFQRHAAVLATGYTNAQQALVSLLQTQNEIEKQGVKKTIATWQTQLRDYSQPSTVRDQLAARIRYVNTLVQGKAPAEVDATALQGIQEELVALVGDQPLVDEIAQQLHAVDADGLTAAITAFVKAHKDASGATGRLFSAARAAQSQSDAVRKLEQAHANIDIHETRGLLSDVDAMTSTYLQGKSFYFSQACYACHRIAGFARGGVGPELTQSGYSYPWFLKQKLVWPQGDLKTSTMPNMHLDHTQLEALTTFLLAQKGQTRSISDVDYQVNLKQWESGKKLPWEQPLTPDLIHNLDNSMTIFATEGCAACHRMRGFTSDVGFAVEKQNNPTLATVTVEREWFRRVIPELVGGNDIPGSVIVNQLEQYADEIDQRIVAGVRHDSLLERIEKQNPGLLESFYSNFAYARRHKNTALTGQALKQWQDRVHRVLMTYIQEYGLGRLVGPRPNWSGIYRSDAWLMEHFREPTALVARSLMPVFPFDTSKFLALTYMLNQIGKRNLEDNHALWDLNGFSPAEAYHLYCSQCHGVAERRDEAPVAQWIYPIPKNLRNAIFLRNLTRPRIIESITHGVKGTPMPPWGETPDDKPFDNDVPVLRADEIVQLTDWLLRSLPEWRTRGEGDSVPKWDYTPDDVIRELQEEGDTLDDLAPKSSTPAKGFLASLTPMPAPADDVTDLFDVVDNPIVGDPDNQEYFIKRHYYTQENLDAGRELFTLNCVICHGNEGGGDGLRAGEMSDAKPRMFTNANWGRTRDDLRLLRSIKYGVPGTSMVPFGDVTSSLQRLQLVMYIRHLSEGIETKDELATALYEAFDANGHVIRNARLEQYAAVEGARREYEAARKRRQEFQSDSTAEAVKAYEQELELQTELKQATAKDQQYLDLVGLLANERALYARGGKALLNAGVDPQLFTAYLDLIRLNDNRYAWTDGKLTMHEVPEDQRQAAVAKIFGQIDREIQQLNTQIEQVKGQISSAARRSTLHALDESIKNLEKLKNELTSIIADAARLRDQQSKMQFTGY